MIYDTNTQDTYENWTNGEITIDKHDFFMVVLLYNMIHNIHNYLYYSGECVYNWNYERIVLPFTRWYKPGKTYSYPAYYHDHCNHPNIDNHIIFTQGQDHNILED